MTLDSANAREVIIISEKTKRTPNREVIFFMVFLILQESCKFEISGGNIKWRQKSGDNTIQGVKYLSHDAGILCKIFV